MESGCRDTKKRRQAGIEFSNVTLGIGHPANEKLCNNQKPERLTVL